jgi:hypothetical protein
MVGWVVVVVAAEAVEEVWNVERKKEKRET